MKENFDRSHTMLNVIKEAKFGNDQASTAKGKLAVMVDQALSLYENVMETSEY